MRTRRPLTDRRGVLRYAGAVVVTVLAGLAVVAARPQPVTFPPPAEAFTFEIGAGATALLIGVRSGRGGSTQITVVVGDLQASFLDHGAGTTTYRLPFPAAGARREVRVEADPPASVALVHSTAGMPPHRPLPHWQAAAPPLELAPPRPATANRPIAEASVDERDTYGLRLFGVPVRSAPSISAPLVTTVSHGDRLEATCWTTGDNLSNGFPERPLGAYSSDIWFKVGTTSGPGFIPDVRFSRRGRSDRLDLPSCGGP